MNRVEGKINSLASSIAAKLKSGTLTKERAAEIAESFDLDCEEFSRFQNLKSVAVSAGKLTIEEGMTVYRYLGESPATFNKQSIAAKVILNKLFADLIQLAYQ